MTDNKQAGMRSYTDTANTRPLLFGDLVENPAASPDNPTRCGYFVRRGVRSGKLNPGPFAEITDGRGKFWESRIETLIVIERDRIPTVAQPASASGCTAWRPIETAPKDGSYVLISSATLVDIARWSHGSFGGFNRDDDLKWQPVPTPYGASTLPSTERAQP